MLRWVRDEWKNKKDADADTDDGWSVEIPKDIPRQMNGCDCGVFMLKYADYIATGVPPHVPPARHGVFSAKDRRRRHGEGN